MIERSLNFSAAIAGTKLASIYQDGALKISEAKTYNFPSSGTSLTHIFTNMLQKARCQDRLLRGMVWLAGMVSVNCGSHADTTTDVFDGEVSNINIVVSGIITWPSRTHLTHPPNQHVAEYSSDSLCLACLVCLVSKYWLTASGTAGTAAANQVSPCIEADFKATLAPGQGYYFDPSNAASTSECISFTSTEVLSIYQRSEYGFSRAPSDTGAHQHT